MNDFVEVDVVQSEGEQESEYEIEVECLDKAEKGKGVNVEHASKVDKAEQDVKDDGSEQAVKVVKAELGEDRNRDNEVKPSTKKQQQQPEGSKLGQQQHVNLGQQ
nr:hypothetical protein Iba_chr02bCG8780 [Ipomoea batatas]